MQVYEQNDWINRLKFAYSYLDSNPEKNIPKLMDWVDRLAKKNAMEGQRKAIRKVIEEKIVTGNN